MSTFKLAFILQVIGKGTIFKSPDKLFFFFKLAKILLFEAISMQIPSQSALTLYYLETPVFTTVTMPF